jgi:hypothetical protein
MLNGEVQSFDALKVALIAVRTGTMGSAAPRGGASSRSDLPSHPDTANSTLHTAKSVPYALGFTNVKTPALQFRDLPQSPAPAAYDCGPRHRNAPRRATPGWANAAGDRIEFFTSRVGHEMDVKHTTHNSCSVCAPIRQTARTFSPVMAVQRASRYTLVTSIVQISPRAFRRDAESQMLAS